MHKFNFDPSSLCVIWDFPVIETLGLVSVLIFTDHGSLFRLSENVITFVTSLPCLIIGSGRMRRGLDGGVTGRGPLPFQVSDSLEDGLQILSRCRRGGSHDGSGCGDGSRRRHGDMMILHHQSSLLLLESQLLLLVVALYFFLSPELIGMTDSCDRYRNFLSLYL